MNQREKLIHLLTKHCNEVGSRTFSLKDLDEKYKDYSVIGIRGQTPQATIRRLLQELRDMKIVSFVNNSGHYTLRTPGLLDDEKSDIESIDISKESPNKKEYLIETYARKVGWAKKAKEIYGSYCMMDNCQNTFITYNNVPYIEVHHIIPLYQKGEDGIWNLSVLCAHHHRMAHFAQESIVVEMQETLLLKVKNYEKHMC